MADDKKWTAGFVSIHPVENGYIVSLQTFAAQLQLVAKDMSEVIAILNDTDVRVLVRPEYAMKARYVNDVPGSPDMGMGMAAAQIGTPSTTRSGY